MISTMSMLTHIRNFLRIDDRLATSGMPQPEDFAALRAVRLWIDEPEKRR
jgi:hypothetical protein